MHGMATPVCCVFGQPMAQEDSLHAVRALQDHIVEALGAEPLDRWTVEQLQLKHDNTQVNYKLRPKKTKATGSEMKFGVNVAAPFAGMKRDDGSNYPYAKQYWVKRSELGARLLVVQEMAKGIAPPTPQTPEVGTSGVVEGGMGWRDPLQEGMLIHVLEGGNELEARLASKHDLVARLKAAVDGQVYKLGDFIIRVGSCRKGAVYKGLVLEVEYLPSCRVADGLAMIEAFLPNVDEGDQLVPASDLRNAVVFGNHPMYSAKHTAVQTTDLFNRVFT